MYLLLISTHPGLLGGLTDTVGKTTSGVTNTVGNTVGSAGKGLGDTVGSATKGVSDTTKGTPLLHSYESC